jgi:hypothetical protein
MIAIRREFVVEVPHEAAWQDLSQIERWPIWAKHIKRVEAIPAGELGRVEMLAEAGRMATPAQRQALTKLALEGSIAGGSRAKVSTTAIPRLGLPSNPCFSHD